MIVVPVKTEKENSAVSPLFGKAKWFALISEGKTEIVRSALERGSEVYDWILSLGAKTLIVSHIGKRPFEMLTDGKVEVYFAGDERILLNDLMLKYADGDLARLDKQNFDEYIKEHNHSGHAHDHSHKQAHGEGSCGARSHGFGVNRSGRSHSRCCS